ncbi:choline sulfatase [Lojkania enalia]|uniref:Choline sulfatase n=1 Tax=Lojkania enalia TaxID=147567 RepID=A0A9P4KAY5_9PLEO|nr:choline sulfatase [Didymosphaeria enalia]
MAPGAIYQTPSSPEAFAPHYPVPFKAGPKQAGSEGIISREATAPPVGGPYPIHSAAPVYGNGPPGEFTGNVSAVPQMSGHESVSPQTVREQALVSLGGNAAHEGLPKKPNVLYIMADQMAAPLLKMNNPDSVIKTPNIDALAESGVVFSSAYCNSPLCAPSRFTMLAGQLPSRIQGYDNASIISSQTPTYAHYLRREGYETVLAGKMHFIGKDQLHGFERRLTTDIYPGDLGWSVNWDKPDERQEWYHNMSSVMQAGPCVRSNQLDYDEDVMFKASQYLYDYVRLDPKTRRPFALTVSLTHPHDPYTMTRDYWDRYEGVDIPLPEVQIPQEEQDSHTKRLLKCIDLWDNPVPDEAAKRARRAYFSACTFVDDQVGKIRKILKDCHLADDTIIVFSGDHGDMLGERSLWYKMSWFEMSARVPLIIHSPSRFTPKRVSQSVSTMDLLPTFVDLVGGDRTAILPIDGVSLYNYLVSNELGKDEVFGEYMGEGTITPVVMIRRGQWKYTTSLVDEPQLFNLVNDPRELNNLARSSKPEHVQVLQAFGAEARKKWNLEEIHKDVLKCQRERRVCFTALQLGEKDSWDYQPPLNDRDRYIRSHISLDDLERRARYPVVDYLGRQSTAAATHHGAAGAIGE